MMAEAGTTAADTLYYFAYGSNLYLPRMQRRVPSARPVTVARLPGHRPAFHKVGEDGSTKCSIVADEEETVWGVVYRMAAGERGLLDEAEGPGYEIIDVAVATPGDEWMHAFTYRALPATVGNGWPYSWYRDLIVHGARHHALPASYIARIADVTSVPDPDPARERANRPRPW